MSARVSNTHRLHALAWVFSQLLDCQADVDHLALAQAHSQRLKQQRVAQDVLALVLQQNGGQAVRGGRQYGRGVVEE
jgi:hypothetical protein